MATALVVRAKRYKKVGDKESGVVYTLRRKSKDAKLYDLARVAADIEALGGMSAEDVEHVGKALIRQIRQTLTDGNSVKIDGLGIFYTTFKCEPAKTPEECSVKNISKVNLRFRVANSLRLVNESVATTKGAANNISFQLVSEDITASVPSGGNENTSGGGGNSGGGDDELDPLG
ncbi:MAG: DNA-binding protein [Bacteroides sp.]|jgi:predicted histone-like DNA-binding protein|nr:DNA-binding protein [Bacteroides sp.]